MSFFSSKIKIKVEIEETFIDFAQLKAFMTVFTGIQAIASVLYIENTVWVAK